MAIRKEPSARLFKQNVTHDAIAKQAVELITDPIALAIYTYLLTKQSNWIVRRADIINRFDPLGRKAYDRAMRQLKDLGLVWLQIKRGDDGRILSNELIVEQTPKCTLSHTSDRNVPLPTIGETECPVLPQGGKGDHLNKDLFTRQRLINKHSRSSNDELVGAKNRFNRFWKAYPRKTAKPNAIKAFDNHVKNDSTLELILNNIAQRIEAGEWTPDCKQYIPHAATYLNGERWNDEIVKRNNGKHSEHGESAIDNAMRKYQQWEQSQSE